MCAFPAFGDGLLCRQDPGQNGSSGGLAFYSPPPPKPPNQNPTNPFALSSPFSADAAFEVSSSEYFMTFYTRRCNTTKHPKRRLGLTSVPARRSADFLGDGREAAAPGGSGGEQRHRPAPGKACPAAGLPLPRGLRKLSPGDVTRFIAGCRSALPPQVAGGPGPAPGSGRVGGDAAARRHRPARRRRRAAAGAPALGRAARGGGGGRGRPGVG